MAVARRFNGGNAKAMRSESPQGRLRAWLGLKQLKSMPLEHSMELLFKTHPTVMPLLIVDISNCGLKLGDADSKCPISVLPVKPSIIEMVVDPLR